MIRLLSACPPAQRPGNFFDPAKDRRFHRAQGIYQRIHFIRRNMRKISSFAGINGILEKRAKTAPEQKNLAFLKGYRLR